jgi:hypothetical protein
LEGGEVVMASTPVGVTGWRGRCSSHRRTSATVVPYCTYPAVGSTRRSASVRVSSLAVSQSRTERVVHHSRRTGDEVTDAAVAGVRVAAVDGVEDDGRSLGRGSVLSS